MATWSNQEDSLNIWRVEGAFSAQKIVGSRRFKDTGVDLEAYLRQLEGRGGLTEQGIAQQLRAVMGEPTRRGQLFHWRPKAVPPEL